MGESSRMPSLRTNVWNESAQIGDQIHCFNGLTRLSVLLKTVVLDLLYCCDCMNHWILNIICERGHLDDQKDAYSGLYDCFSAYKQRSSHKYSTTYLLRPSNVKETTYRDKPISSEMRMCTVLCQPMLQERSKHLYYEYKRAHSYTLAL